MLQATKGIVLRAVKYGETSLIVSVYTDQFGIQSYIVNGVRAEKKGGTKAGMFQVGAILDMVVYHQDLHNLQRIREFKWGFVYREIYSSIFKTILVMYMMELLHKCLKQPEPNAELFAFVENALIALDGADDSSMANFALHFTLTLASWMGFRIGGQYCERTPFLDLLEGVYTEEHPPHAHSLDGYLAETTSMLLDAKTTSDLALIRLNQEMRRALLLAYQQFYGLHVPDFGALRSLAVLQDILS